MTTEDESHIIRTSGRRMAKGLAIIVIMIAFGAAVAVPNWHNFAKNPPPVSTITTKTASSAGAEGGATTSAAGGGGGGASTTAASSQSTALPAGATAITILAGASVQGNPGFQPADSKVPLGSKVVWQNKDTTVHTATSGSGPSDPNSGKAFDTKMINAGANSDPVDITNSKVGDVIAYYCQIHPYMTGKLSVTAASGAGGGTAGTAGGSSTAAGGAATSGPALTIPQGASVQGNPSYEPATLSVKKGDTIQVQNKDTTPHTVTSGKTLEDPNKGKDFDSSIIAPSASAQISTANLKPGEIPFHCDLHPYMTGTLKVQ
jgi:plastocyanin